MVKGDGVEQQLLGVDAQVRSIGQVAAQQTVGVLVDAPLPRAVGMGKEHMDANGLGQRLVMRHLLAVVVRHRPTHGRIDAAQDCAKALSVLHSTRVPIWDWFLAPLMRSPSQ